jgi:membrane protein YdbS with pleckstrin-like domain
MLATSPLAIIFYVILAMLLVSTIGRRLAKEKLIDAILRTPSSNITRTINSYRTVVKMWKMLIVGDVVLIPLLVYLYFAREKGEWTILVAAGIITLLVIKAIEDIQYRKSVIARLETEQAKSQKVGASHISEKEFDARVRKWKLIALAISVLALAAVVAAFYFTAGGPWWFYALVSIILLSAVALGFWLGQRQNPKKRSD